MNIVAFCDTYKTGIEPKTGLQIIRPESLKEYGDAIIVIGLPDNLRTNDVQDIEQELIQQNVKHENILRYSQLLKLLYNYNMEYISSGAQADVYKDGSKAIKIYKPYVQKREIEYEANLQKMAFDYGLPVPEIYDIIEIDGQIGMVMEYINGVPLSKIILENKSDKKLEEYLVKSIEIQDRINKIETDKFPPMRDMQKCCILRTNKLAGEEKDKILNKIENISYENKLCHGDLHFLNLIQTSDDLKIIDWGHASSGNPDADICHTYLLYKMYFNNFHDISSKYLEIYCKIKKIDMLKIMSWLSIVAGVTLEELEECDIEEDVLKEIIRNNM
jgi:uncharacterized protein (TIGR02172 family)